MRQARSALIGPALKCIPVVALLLCPLWAGAASEKGDKPASAPNVLFIAVDDLRPQLNCYGRSQMHTPHIDQLASSGTLFERAYAMVPTCGASRASLMTGIRPSPNRFVGYRTWAERDAPGIPTLNDHFKANGYHTASFGKVFHHAADSKDGWSGPNRRPGDGWTGYVLEKNIARTNNDKPGRGYPYEAADKPDSRYLDYKIADAAMEHMATRKNEDKPWFLAVGLYKPHLPFAAPKKYWDLYSKEDIHLPPNYESPENAPGTALHNSGELRSYRGVPESGPVSDDMARRMIHGYYACVSFADAQVGRLLDRLEKTGQAQNTIVVLWGDHGWQLGEHGMWCKHCTFETSMQVPLIVRAPGMDDNQRTRGLTELIDLYPSLCELTGLPKPDHLDGRSFVPLLKNPDRSWKAAAVGRFRAGDTIRTPRYRYSEYRAKGGRGQIRARMLYDHQIDPAETVNIAGRADVKAVIDRLSSNLQSIKGKDGRFEEAGGETSP
jgi:arylsulfatase A-like enzyme